MSPENSKPAEFNIIQIEATMFALCRYTISQTPRDDGALVVFRSPSTNTLWSAVAYWSNHTDHQYSHSKNRGDLRLSFITHEEITFSEIATRHAKGNDKLRPIVCTTDLLNELSENGWMAFGSQSYGFALDSHGHDIEIFTPRNASR